ncbi:putative E3 ubiquitin-protein ligase ubr7 [Rhizophlyctis rosea]|nr:putative E3 ubiquitin-protein ligase ubr7 [Rhizophlyctis rosea]
MTDAEKLTGEELIANNPEVAEEAAELYSGNIEKCSFEHGYVRQQVYSCRTCADSNNQPVGICYACQDQYLDHDIVELFYKRHFRCDCGSSGLREPCTLQPKSLAQNTENVYNDNFKGIFCFCRKLYEPESESDTMLECIFCEDWFHTRCIGELPDLESFEDYICRNCSAKHRFILAYRSFPGVQIFERQVKDVKRGRIDDADGEESEGSKRVKLNGANDVESSTGTKNGAVSKNEAAVEAEGQAEQKKETHAGGPTEKKEEGGKGKEPAVTVACIIEGWETSVPHAPCDVFCPKGWWSEICRCSKCKKMYSESGLPFLLERETTFEPEEDEGDEEVEMDESMIDGMMDEMAMSSLKGTDRVTTLEFLYDWKRLKDDFKMLLKGIKEEGRSVRKEDIDAFFESQRKQFRERRQQSS